MKRLHLEDLESRQLFSGDLALPAGTATLQAGLSADAVTSPGRMALIENLFLVRQLAPAPTSAPPLDTATSAAPPNSGVASLAPVPGVAQNDTASFGLQTPTAAPQPGWFARAKPATFAVPLTPPGPQAGSSGTAPQASSAIYPALAEQGTSALPSGGGHAVVAASASNDTVVPEMTDSTPAVQTQSAGIPSTSPGHAFSFLARVNSAAGALPAALEHLRELRVQDRGTAIALKPQTAADPGSGGSAEGPGPSTEAATPESEPSGSTPLTPPGTPPFALPEPERWTNFAVHAAAEGAAPGGVTESSRPAGAVEKVEVPVAVLHHHPSLAPDSFVGKVGTQAAAPDAPRGPTDGASGKGSSYVLGSLIAVDSAAADPEEANSAVLRHAATSPIITVAATLSAEEGPSAARTFFLGLPVFGLASGQPLAEVAALEQTMRQLLQQVHQAGQALPETARGLSAWVLAGAAATLACELARRQLGRGERAPALDLGLLPVRAPTNDDEER